MNEQVWKICNKVGTDRSVLKWKKAASHATTWTDTEDTNYAEGNEPARQDVVAGRVWCGSALNLTSSERQG